MNTRVAQSFAVLARMLTTFGNRREFQLRYNGKTYRPDACGWYDFPVRQGERFWHEPSDRDEEEHWENEGGGIVREASE